MTQRDIAIQKDETPVTAALRQLAGIMGWAVMHTTDGGHAKTSYHYSGRAVDLAAREGPGVDTSALLTINEQIIQVLPLSMISELIYSGPGNTCVKNGRVVAGLAAYGRDVMSRHHNHVHLAVIATFTYQGPHEEVAVPDNARPRVNAPVAGIAITPSGNGYLIVCQDGGVFAFGDAKFLGNVEYQLPAGDDWSPAN